MQRGLVRWGPRALWLLPLGCRAAGGGEAGALRGCLGFMLPGRRTWQSRTTPGATPKGSKEADSRM